MLDQELVGLLRECNELSLRATEAFEAGEISQPRSAGSPTAWRRSGACCSTQPLRQVCRSLLEVTRPGRQLRVDRSTGEATSV
jgi:hypothetical protein